MNEKFTPGKWQADPETGSIYEEITNCLIGIATHIEEEEYEANLRLLAHAKDLYHVVVMARFFVPEGDQIGKAVEKVLREINPDFDKRPEIPDIRKFAERVKVMREWQKRYFETRDKDVLIESKRLEAQVDKYAAEILEEADNGKS